jgi:hypothetical protein
MLALTALTLALFGMSTISNVPKLIKLNKEKKQEKMLENILSKQGSAENVKKDNLENVYLNNLEFEKYFGQGSTAQGYVKQGSGKTNVKTFINLNSQTCPLLDYMIDMTEEITSSLAPNTNPTQEDLKYFTLDNIKLGAKTYSAISNDSLTPELVDTEASLAAGKLLGQYVASGLVEKRLLDPNLPLDANTNPEIFIINPDMNDLRTIKRYAVESGVVTFLGCLDKNYSSFENGKMTIMPTNESYVMKITNDEKLNKEVLEKVLLNCESAMLTDGLVIKKDANGWKPVIDSFVNQSIILAPEQYVNYVNIRQKYESEEEEKKSQLALAQRNGTPVVA